MRRAERDTGGAGIGRIARSALLVGLPALACSPPEPSLEARMDASLARALDFLAARQSEDGTWVSATYGNLKDGRALTASLAKVMLFNTRAGERTDEVTRAVEALIAAAREDGTIDPGPYGMAYPVYTAALAVLVLNRPGAPYEGRPGVRAASDAWIRLLHSHQLDDDLGWSPHDLAYGGWGYSLEPPEKGAGGAHFDADLSSTLFAVGALRLAGIPADDRVIVRARLFVQRCQNFGTGAPDFDDGGFFFTPTNEPQNKAGVSGVDGSGRTRYHSYGAMTADGVRALLRCGFEPDDPRVIAARTWLEERFDPASNPGTFDPERELERDASYYYWCWSAAHAFYALEGGPAGWPEALAEELLARQRDDGSWVNRFTMVKEDDPLVATAFAAAALSLCRLQLLAEP